MDIKEMEKRYGKVSVVEQNVYRDEDGNVYMVFPEKGWRSFLAYSLASHYSLFGFNTFSPSFVEDAYMANKSRIKGLWAMIVFNDIFTYQSYYKGDMKDVVVHRIVSIADEDDTIKKSVSDLLRLHGWDSNEVEKILRGMSDIELWKYVRAELGKRDFADIIDEVVNGVMEGHKDNLYWLFNRAFVKALDWNRIVGIWEAHYKGTPIGGEVERIGDEVVYKVGSILEEIDDETGKEV